MSGLAKLKNSYYDPISEEEQTSLANSMNTFYTRFYSYTPPDDASVPDSASVSDTASVHNAASAPDVAPVPDSESSVNTTVPDAAVDVPTSPAFCDPTEITMEEVIKQFSRCKVGQPSGKGVRF